MLLIFLIILASANCHSEELHHRSNTGLCVAKSLMNRANVRGKIGSSSKRIFYRCMSVHGGGGACVVAPGGHVWLLPRGMRGCFGRGGGVHGKGGHVW